jgi:hypothetical protein
MARRHQAGDQQEMRVISWQDGDVGNADDVSQRRCGLYTSGGKVLNNSSNPQPTPAPMPSCPPTSSS